MCIVIWSLLPLAYSTLNDLGALSIPLFFLSPHTVAYLRRRGDGRKHWAGFSNTAVALGLLAWVSLGFVTDVDI